MCHEETLKLTADDHMAISANAMHLENRLGDVETDCCNRLHAWLLQIVGAHLVGGEQQLGQTSKPSEPGRTSKPCALAVCVPVQIPTPIGGANF